MQKITHSFLSPLVCVIAGLLPVLFSCKNTGAPDSASSSQEPYAKAIRIIFAKDDRLATIRNHACEDTTLAETVRQYVAAIDAMDFSRCPTDFALAFKKHRDAWENTISFFTKFDTLRGEMHELFAVIEKMGPDQKVELDRISRPIGETWSEVKELAGKYGAPPEE